MCPQEQHFQIPSLFPAFYFNAIDLVLPHNYACVKTHELQHWIKGGMKALQISNVERTYATLTKYFIIHLSLFVKLPLCNTFIFDPACDIIELNVISIVLWWISSDLLQMVYHFKFLQRKVKVDKSLASLQDINWINRPGINKL